MKKKILALTCLFAVLPWALASIGTPEKRKSPITVQGLKKINQELLLSNLQAPNNNNKKLAQEMYWRYIVDQALVIFPDMEEELLFQFSKYRQKKLPKLDKKLVKTKLLGSGAQRINPYLHEQFKTLDLMEEWAAKIPHRELSRIEREEALNFIFDLLSKSS